MEFEHFAGEYLVAPFVDILIGRGVFLYCGFFSCVGLELRDAPMPGGRSGFLLFSELTL